MPGNFMRILSVMAVAVMIAVFFAAPHAIAAASDIKIDLVVSDSGETTAGINTTSGNLVVDPCDYTLYINTTKQLFNYSEAIAFRHAASRDLPSSFAIDYWIEDALGAIVRQAKTTRNLLVKSATLKPAVTTAYLIKSHLIIDGCADRLSYKSERLVVVLGKESRATSNNTVQGSGVETAQNQSQGVSQAADKPNIILNSFYTLAKKPVGKINVFANIQGYGYAALSLNSPIQTITDNFSVSGSVKKTYSINILPGYNNITAELCQDGFQKQHISFSIIGLDDGTQAALITEDNKSIIIVDNLSDDSETSMSNTEKPSPRDSVFSASSTNSNLAGSQNNDISQALSLVEKNSASGLVVFESSTLKRNKMIPFLLAGVTGLICIFLLMRRL